MNDKSLELNFLEDNRDAYLKNLENIWLYLSKNVPLQNYAIYTKYEGTVDGFV